MRDYAKTINHDENIGRVLDYLEKNNMMEYYHYLLPTKVLHGEHGWFTNGLCTKIVLYALDYAIASQIQKRRNCAISTKSILHQRCSKLRVEIPSDIQGVSLLRYSK